MVHRRRPRREENHHVGQPSLEPEELLQRLKVQQRVFQWGPLPPDEPRRFKEVDHSRSKRSLEFLHQHWAIPDSFDPALAGRGLRGRFLSFFGRMTYQVLSPYFREERDLLAHLVRVNEALEQRCEDLALRYQQLSQDMLDRQVAEAENLTELALWLHREPPHPETAETGEIGTLGIRDSTP
jgi:hypothetical protein